MECLLNELHSTNKIRSNLKLDEQSLKKCFLFLDVKDQGYLVGENLSEFFKLRKINFSDKELSLLEQELDLDKDGKISILDFLEYFLS